MSYRDFNKWLSTSEESIKFNKIINKSLNAIREGKKPIIDYEIHPKLSAELYTNIYIKILATTRYSTYNLVQDKVKENTTHGHKKLSEKDKEEIMQKLE